MSDKGEQLVQGHAAAAGRAGPSRLASFVVCPGWGLIHPSVQVCRRGFLVVYGKCFIEIEFTQHTVRSLKVYSRDLECSGLSSHLQNGLQNVLVAPAEDLLAVSNHCAFSSGCPGPRHARCLSAS